MRLIITAMTAALLAAPVAAQQPLTDVRVVEATWIRDVALTRWENDRPVIYVNPRLLERFGPTMRDFFIGHEFGHVALAHEKQRQTLNRDEAAGHAPPLHHMGVGEALLERAVDKNPV